MIFVAMQVAINRSVWSTDTFGGLPFGRGIPQHNVGKARGALQSKHEYEEDSRFLYAHMCTYIYIYVYTYLSLSLSLCVSVYVGRYVWTEWYGLSPGNPYLSTWTLLELKAYVE